MGLFGGKKKPAAQERAAAPSGKEAANDPLRESMDLPTDPDAPWVLAQRHMDDRFLRIAAQSENWRKSFYIVLGVAALMGVGLVVVAMQARVEPIYIAVDKLGRTSEIASGLNAGGKVDAALMVDREMREFVENVRTVTSDFAANNKALGRAFSRLAGAAHGYVKNDLQSHKPNDVAQKKTIDAEIKIAFPITSEGKQQNSWQAEWVETSYDLRGELIGTPEIWRATIQYELRPGKTMEELKANSIGFFVTGISWAKLK